MAKNGYSLIGTRTLSRARVLNTVEASILSPVKMLSLFAEALCRPAECFRPNMSKIVPKKYNKKIV